MTKDEAKQAVLAAFAKDVETSFPALAQMAERISDAADADRRIAAAVAFRLRVCDVAEAAIDAHFDGKP